MNRLIISIALALVCTMTHAQQLKSPDGNLTLGFEVDAEGSPVYSLDYKGKAVIKPSHLGLDIFDD